MAQKRMTMLASNAYSRLNLLATGAMTWECTWKKKQQQKQVKETNIWSSKK